MSRSNWFQVYHKIDFVIPLAKFTEKYLWYPIIKNCISVAISYILQTIFCENNYYKDPRPMLLLC